MSETWRVITPSPYEPITIEEAKAHCRITGNADDALLAASIAAAREYVEGAGWVTLMPSVQAVDVDAWSELDGLRLPQPPIQNVTAVTYRDDADSESTLDVSAYRVDTVTGRIFVRRNATLPTVELRESGAITVTYLAGHHNALATAETAPAIRAALPQALVAALKLVVGHLYENREGSVIGAGLMVGTLPMGVDALLRLHRPFRF